MPSLVRPYNVALLALTSAAACGPADSPPVATRVDSAGIEIVTSSDSLWTPDTRWTLSPEPTLTIGGDLDAPDPYQLVTVSDAMRRSDGSVVVVNSGTREVRIFSSEGEHLQTLGGPGEGPEEYGYPMGLRPGPGDGFSVRDRFDAVHYDGAGEFVGRETFDRAEWMEIMRSVGPSEGGVELPDGRMVAPVYAESFFGSGTPTPGPAYRPPITIVRVDRATRDVDTLASIGGILQQYVDAGQERPTNVVPPFAPSGRYLVAHDGSMAIYDGAEPEVRQIDDAGAHRIVRWVSEGEPVSAAEVDAQLDEFRNASWIQPRIAEMERAWAQMDLPTHKPHVTLAHSALDGSLWVRTTGSRVDDARWRIFSSDGRWLGTLELPGGFVPMEIDDDYLLGVHTDVATEVQTVVMYSLDKP